ncbi:MAG: hypothetical protein R3F61_01725 [Myxococcota bacterium]
MRLRRARLDDVPAMLEVKRSLRFTGSAEGGFLLGSDAAGYRAHLTDSHCWVIEGPDTCVQGFAIVQGDRAFRASEVFARRGDVRWQLDPEPVLALRLAWFEQLAVRRGPYRRWGAAVAYTALRDAMHDADALLTATVQSPVTNLAAVPYLERFGGTRVGRIDEVYPDFGPLVSDIWLVRGDAMEARHARPHGAAETWVRDTADRALSSA